MCTRLPSLESDAWASILKRRAAGRGREGGDGIVGEGGEEGGKEGGQGGMWHLPAATRAAQPHHDTQHTAHSMVVWDARRPPRVAGATVFGVEGWHRACQTRGGGGPPPRSCTEIEFGRDEVWMCDTCRTETNSWVIFCDPSSRKFHCVVFRSFRSHSRGGALACSRAAILVGFGVDEARIVARNLALLFQCVFVDVWREARQKCRVE